MAIPDNAIAIVGMACRFPLGRDVDEYWENLCSGVEAIRPLTADELRGLDGGHARHQNFVSVASDVADIERFDAAFFDMTQREAEILDPQFRLLLESSYLALEQAGMADRSFPRDVGVFVGTGGPNYANFHLATHPEVLSAMGQMAVSIANDKDFAATQIAYRLNLRGPAISINTACSTSLVAVHQAANALLNFECDAALAGGATVHPAQATGYLYQQGGILSPDGHCRAFAANAEGTVGGNGGGVVLLKRLEDALRDGDTIDAVIAGSAVNNDGTEKVGMTAPSVSGQARAIREAIAIAELPCDAIGYIEAHGTGTTMGDPVEVAALNDAYSEFVSSTHKCPLGTVKSNMGHLDTGAGIAGLIKAALAVKHGVIPPSLHCEPRSTKVPFDDGPFYPAGTLTSWPHTAHGRYAGVSSFGIGGTNAHVVLCAPPNPPTKPPAAETPNLVMLSARSTGALGEAARRLREFALAGGASVPSIAAAYGRQPQYPHRLAVVAHTSAELSTQLDTSVLPAPAHTQPPPVVWVFPGQGAQYPTMGRALYQSMPDYRAAFDRCTKIARSHGVDLQAIVHDASNEAAARLADTELTQIAVFAVEFALAEQWKAFGVRPDVVLGHSLGEYVAACHAGVFTLEDAIAAVITRGRLIASLPPGAMLSVGGAVEHIEDRDFPGVEIACTNAPDHLVLSGELTPISEVADVLQSEGYAVRRLATSHAFHSRSLEAVLEPFADAIASRALGRPEIPIISNVFGAPLLDHDAADPAYWVRHMRDPVRFSSCVAYVEEQCPGATYLEVGPGQTTRSLLLKNGVARDRIVASMRRAESKESDTAVFYQAAGKLWQHGLPLELSRLVPADTTPCRVPGYAFDRQRHWIDPDPEAFNASPSLSDGNGLSVTQMRWRSCVPNRANATSPSVLFATRPDDRGHGIEVVAGHGFRQLSDTQFEIRPDSVDDMEQLLTALPKDLALDYFWCVESHSELPQMQRITEQIRKLRALAEGLRRVLVPGEGRIVRVFLDQPFQVTGSDSVNPVSRAAAAAVRSIFCELPDAKLCVVDVNDPDASCERVGYLDQPLQAIRGVRQFVPSFESTSEYFAAPKTVGTVLVIGATGKSGPGIVRAFAQRANHVIAAGRRSSSALSRDDSALSLTTVIAEHPNVSYEPLDVTDDARLTEKLRELKGAFGGLDLIVHAAGAMSAECMQTAADLVDSDIQTQLEAKVAGGHALLRAADAVDAGTIVFMSSLAGTLGGLGMAAYAAAVAYQDAMAERSDREGLLSIAWDGLQTGDGNVDGVLSAEQVVDTIVTTMAAAGDVYFASLGNIEQRFRAATRPLRRAARPEKEKRTDTPVDLPVTRLEKAVAAAFEGLTGVSPVGLEDDFFTLGGDSLLATQLCSQLASQLDVDLPISLIFESSKVRELAQRIVVLQSETVGDDLADMLARIDSMDTAQVEQLLAESGQ